jgi:Tfp pilus assembly protein PilF
LKGAVTKEPTPRREFHLALCYLKSGDQRDGETMLAAALAKDPSLAQSGAW